ncbi:MAG: hypothetical protein PHQ27_06040 [Victivallales bacterium]|nr:hypothetical protein [Victivallales bacterium]
MMISFFSRFFTAGAAVLLAIVAMSCQSRGYYVERAVGDARDFVLEHMRELTPDQRNFIRYNKPVMYAETYSGGDFWVTVQPLGGNDYCQMCAVWNVPGEKLPIIVFGVSDHGVRGWYPVKIMRRHFRTMEAVREQAIKNAMMYAMNEMLYLQTSDRNRIRFSPPRIFVTKFALGISGRGKDLQQSVQNENLQVSFVWPSDEAGRQVVISGLCRPNYQGFITIIGQLRTPEDLKAHTVAPADKTPELAGKAAVRKGATP